MDNDINPSVYESFSTKLLEGIRTVMSQMGVNKDRLPGWVEAANVRSCTQLSNTTVFVVEPGYEGSDQFTYESSMSSDIELIFNDDQLNPDDKFSLLLSQPDVGAESGVVQMATHPDNPEEGNAHIQIPPKRYFRATQKPSYHYVNVVHEVFLSIYKDGNNLRTSFIPMAIYIHDDDFNRISEVLEDCVKQICRVLGIVATSNKGDYFEMEYKRIESFEISLKNSVIVLGDYDGGPHEQELEETRDVLKRLGYKSYLIRELPGNSSKPLSHKVKMWSLGSKFVVIVDRDPSGHIREYTDLVGENIPIALLRRDGSGSTFMIGHERHTDDYINQFEFEERSIEVLEEASNWAEDFTSRMSDVYDEEFPWRGQ